LKLATLVYNYLDSMPVLDSIRCIDSKRHTHKVKCMYNGSDLTAVIETSSDTTYKEQANIDIYRCGTKRRLSKNNNKRISTISQMY